MVVFCHVGSDELKVKARDGSHVVSPTYLIIGHVTRDLLPGGGATIGGTATFAARTAHALGCQVAVVTSAAPDLELSEVLAGVEVVRHPSAVTTTFENVYTSSGREQYLHAVAESLSLEHVPSHWRQPDVVHLAPLNQECDASLAAAFPGAMVGITPQGWIRTWDESGRVGVGDWVEAEAILRHTDAVVLSQEDVGGDEARIQTLAQQTPILVETLGAVGSRVYARGQVRRVPAQPRPEVDPTGAGDIFAAAFFVRLHQLAGQDPWAAAAFANHVAALSVEKRGWAGTPTPQEIAGVLQT